MASGIWKLRLTQLLNFQLSSPALLIKRVLIALVSIGLAVSVAVTPHFFGANPEQLGAIDTILWSVVIAVTACIAFFNSQHLLDPRQFAGFSTKLSTISWGLLLSSVLTWPALIVFLWFSVTVTLRIANGAEAWAVAISGALAFIGVIVTARLFAVLGTLTITPRNRSMMKGVGAILLAAALPLTVVLLVQALQTDSSAATADASRVLGWTPLGASAAAAVDITTGETGAAILRYLVSVAGVILAVGCWQKLATIAMTSIALPETPGFARSGLGWFERFPAQPWGAIGARSVIYWIRDPRYRMGLLAIPIAPLLVVGVLFVAGVSEYLIVMAPLTIMLLLLGWSVHNDVSADSTAVWSHIASGTSGKDDRIGRIMPVMLVGVPLVIVGSSLSAAILADWRILPALLGLNLGVLCISAGVSSVSSALLPYPFTRPGESPFTQPAGNGLGVSAGLAQCLSMFAAIVLAIPVVWISVIAVTDITFVSNIWALIGSALYGVALLSVGVIWGGKLFEQSSPELLTIAQSFD